MPSTRGRRALASQTLAFACWIAPAGTLFIPHSASALPEYSRIYGATCVTCHSIPPRLNATGLAFQANHFNFTDQMPLRRQTGLKAVPLSALVTFSYDDDRTNHTVDTDFRALELYSSDGFRLGGQRTGGWFVNAIAHSGSEDDPDGLLEDAFVSIPTLGRRGQLAFTAGQFSPMMYQWDPVTSLTEEAPAAIADEIDGFSFADSMPGFRLDYFDRRGAGTADGNYLSVGVPFNGRLQLNHLSRVENQHGLFAHAFRRKKQSTIGVFGYARHANNLGGVMVEREIVRRLHLLGIGAIGHDAAGDSRRASAQAEYVAGPRLAFTARLDLLDGAIHDLGEGGAITFYPLQTQALRISAEFIQRKDDRELRIFARGQF